MRRYLLNLEYGRQVGRYFFIGGLSFNERFCFTSFICMNAYRLIDYIEMEERLKKFITSFKVLMPTKG